MEANRTFLSFLHLLPTPLAMDTPPAIVFIMSVFSTGSPPRDNPSGGLEIG